jgi:hypothetical protein
MQLPTIGRIVHFKLTADQAQQINRRRTTRTAIAERISESKWPLGAQAHMGNHASEGDVLPMIICRIWPDEYGEGIPGVNGQLFLDGNDCLWITSAREGLEPGGPLPGQWFWPPIVR